jgi:alanyl aminopeptidase
MIPAAVSRRSPALAAALGSEESVTRSFAPRGPAAQAGSRRATPLTLLAAAAVAAAAGCGGAAQSDRPTGAASADDGADPGAAGARSSGPGTLRLPPTARPVRYTAELTVIPTEPTFTGAIAIDLELTAATELLWLNADRLTIDTAVLTLADGTEFAARVVPVDRDFVGFAFGRVVQPGAARLSLRYRGIQTRTDGEGIFVEQEAGDWYAYTQFEALAARRAFPCFDEPSHKVPWQLGLRVPADQVAISNTPVASETPSEDGTKLVAFARTPPLPSYLVAFAVGPFAIAEAGTSRAGVPIRIVTARGRAGDAGYAVKTTLPLLDRLEDYFGIPYPYAKLDLVTIPTTQGFGAMENPGMITFRQDMILVRAGELTLRKQQRFASVAAHELAHQWFGNLVTMAWWDDLWLNESFASWAETKVIAGFAPEWGPAIDAVASKHKAMTADSLASARRIRQPIRTNDDIENAFDGITYGKGKAVLGAFEAWVGEEAFRAGIRAYLEAHAWGNATAADFAAAVGKAAGRDVATPLSTFLDQVGAPAVTAELACEPGSAPTVRLTQQRWVPVGSEAEPAQRWQVPVCVKAGVGRRTQRACALLVDERGEIELAGRRCPDWFVANADGRGYYRTRLSGDAWERLLERGFAKLSAEERVDVVGDLHAAVDAGDLPLSAVFAHVDRFAADPERRVVEAAMRFVGSLEAMVPDDLRGKYAELVRTSFGERATALGWRPRKGDTDADRQLRPALLELVAGVGHDGGLASEADALARAWLDDRAEVAPEVVPAMLAVAARHGDRALFDRMRQRAGKATDREERDRLLDAMSRFRDPDITAAAVAIVLTDEFDTRTSLKLVWGALDDERTRAVAFEFVTDNYDALRARLPRDSGAKLVKVGAQFCDGGRRAEVEEFFRDRMATQVGGPRALAQTLEQIALCSARRQALHAEIVAILDGR